MVNKTVNATGHNYVGLERYWYGDIGYWSIFTDIG